MATSYEKEDHIWVNFNYTTIGYQDKTVKITWKMFNYIQLTSPQIWNEYATAFLGGRALFLRPQGSRTHKFFFDCTYIEECD